MKNFIFLFLLLSSVFASAEDCSLAHYAKGLLQTTVEDFFDLKQLRFCGPKDAGNLSSLFWSVENIYRVKNTPLTTAQRSQALEQIDKFRDQKHSLVRVGSELEDLISENRFQITGVGSVIGVASQKNVKNYGELSYFVLTASHLVSGENPFIEVNGQKIATKVVKIDYENDLALLDFSANQQVLPLGIVNQGIVNTAFNMALRKRGELYDMQTGLFLDTLPFEPWVETDYMQPAAVVAKASWLTDEVNMDMNKAGREHFQVPRKQSGAIVAPGYFPRGYSGSPILSTYRLRAPDLGSLRPEFAYVIGGVLSLSSPGNQEAQTVSTSIGQVQKFLTASEKKYQVTENPWVLLGPYFMKWSEENNLGTVYTGPGPIGNGVVVEGKKPVREEKPEKPKKTAFVNRLKEKGSPEEKLRNILTSNTEVKLTQPLSESQIQHDWQEFQKSLTLKSSKD